MKRYFPARAAPRDVFDSLGMIRRAVVVVDKIAGVVGVGAISQPSRTQRTHSQILSN
jgi:hypothetical protein